MILLSGFMCGDVGTVTSLDVDERDHFYACFADGEYRVDRKHDLVVSAESYCVPNWAPPVCLEDFSQLHSALIYRFAEEIEKSNERPLEAVLRSVTLKCWWLRLPLAWSDIWPMLEAHGWPSEGAVLAADRFSFALKTLQEGAGRSPIKRKRMPPMSQGRYLPMRRRR